MAVRAAPLTPDGSLPCLLQGAPGLEIRDGLPKYLGVPPGEGTVSIFLTPPYSAQYSLTRTPVSAEPVWAVPEKPCHPTVRRPWKQGSQQGLLERRYRDQEVLKGGLSQSSWATLPGGSKGGQTPKSGCQPLREPSHHPYFNACQRIQEKHLLWAGITASAHAYLRPLKSRHCSPSPRYFSPSELGSRSALQPQRHNGQE